MKKISILGSTGSIGSSTLKAALHLGPEEIKVSALAAHSNIDSLEKQINVHNPELVAVYDKQKALELQKRLPHIEVLGGMEGIEAVAAYSGSDMVISAISGTLGLLPTYRAIEHGKTVGLANKEALVSGGALLTRLAKEKNVAIIPLDSEHNAIFQCLKQEKLSQVCRLILTASGGPFRLYSMDDLKQVTVEKALKHPTWNMGPKNTIDSSTLMNKGLEIIEAHWLFNIPVEQIEVVVHPQSIIHSMVEFVDNSILAQLSQPSMIIPIQYALTYPERKSGLFPKFDFTQYSKLEFCSPDFEKFLCLALAYKALKAGDSYPGYMNAANEALVKQFIERKISWLEIGTKLERLMDQHQPMTLKSIDDVLALDIIAREEALLI